MMKIPSFHEFINESGKVYKLYHYSTEKYDELLSPSVQLERKMISKKKATSQDKEPEYSGLPKRSKSLSFMLHKAPLDFIKENYPKENFFNSAKTLYEHVVDVMSIEDLKYFTVLESTSDIDLFDSDADLKNKKTFTDQLRKKEESGDAGSEILELQSAVKKYDPRVMQYYKELVKRKDFDELSVNFYSICIPHIMLWTSSGIVIPSKVTQLRY